MAIREVGTVSGTTINGGDLALDLTTITGLAEGDLVIAAFVVADTTDRNMVTNDANTWTEITDLYANDTEDVNLGVFYRYMTSSVDTTVTGEGFGSASAGVAGVARAFRGVATVANGGPFDTAATTATGTDGALANPPSIDHSNADGTVIVIAAGAAQATGSVFASPQTRYQANMRSVTVAETFDASVALTHAPPTADPEDPTAFTNANSASTNSWAACTMALKPATPVGIHLMGMESGSNINGADVTVTLPTNMVEGDLVIFAYEEAGTLSNLDLSMDTADYTEVADLFADDTLDANVGVYYKFMGATPDTTAVANGSGAAADGLAAVVHVYRGVQLVANGGPFDTTTATTTGTSTILADPPSIDWSGSAGRVAVIAVGGTSASNTGAFGKPANYSDFIGALGNDTNDAHVALGVNYAPADPENPAAVTFTAADNTSYSYGAATMILRPIELGSGQLHIMTAFIGL